MRAHPFVLLHNETGWNQARPVPEFRLHRNQLVLRFHGIVDRPRTRIHLAAGDGQRGSRTSVMRETHKLLSRTVRSDRTM